MNDEQKNRFFKEAMISSNVDLEFENFDKFYDARKKVLALKIREMLG